MGQYGTSRLEKSIKTLRPVTWWHDHAQPRTSAERVGTPRHSRRDHGADRAGRLQARHDGVDRTPRRGEQADRLSVVADQGGDPARGPQRGRGRDLTVARHRLVRDRPSHVPAKHGGGRRPQRTPARGADGRGPVRRGPRRGVSDRLSRASTRGTRRAARAWPQAAASLPRPPIQTFWSSSSSRPSGTAFSRRTDPSTAGSQTG